MKVIAAIVAVAFCLKCVDSYIPTSFNKGDYYPEKNEKTAKLSEVKSSGAIRDVIKRNSPRFRKVLVSNTNNMIIFKNEDARYMTSRGKSKLDILGSLVHSEMGQRLFVEKSWTDVIDKNNLLSLHYEGRAFLIRLENHDDRKLSRLMKLALESGFAWVHYIKSEYIHVSVIPDVCQTKVDLAIVVDRSGSVGYGNFKLMQTFLKKMVDFFNVGPDGTHVALISYSSWVKSEFKLTNYYTKDGLKRAIDNMKYTGGGTNTGDALNKLRNDIFTKQNGMRDDPSIPKIGIVLTDGRSTSGRLVSVEAPLVKKKGISMFAVGITRNPKLSEMEDIASAPFDEHYVRIDRFTDLSGFVDQISTISCDEGAQISTCENTATDVDGGSFKYFRVPLISSVKKISVELIDKKGKSFLYVSKTLKNPGPLSDSSQLQKDEGISSPRTIIVNLSNTRGTNIIYIAVQGQEDSNEFSINIWDSLFQEDNVSVDINEDLPPRNVFTVQTRQAASNFDFSINYGNNRGHFRMQGRTISTTQLLDREKVPQYKLSIIAKHKSEKCHKGLMILDVIVKDVNDNIPRFERDYEVSVREDAPAKQYVIQVKATDEDAGENAELEYSISGSPGPFNIEEKTGIVRTSKPLDYETKSSFTLELQVTDKGKRPKTGTGKLVVKIIDVNEPPEFKQPPCVTKQGCIFEVEEELNPGTKVGQRIIAVDTDTKQACILEYEIVSLDKQYFTIGKTDGEIRSKGRIDRELKEYYSLDVKVSDCGSPKLSTSTTVHVRAKDINDNAPTFPYQSAKASVLENAEKGTAVYKFLATDIDFGKNSLVQYHITNDFNNKEFILDSDTGTLTVNEKLDRETKPSIQLEITAKDLGNPMRKSSVNIFVAVTDINDNKPKFQGQTQYYVKENVNRNTKVFKANATDSDEGLNAQIQYSIVKGNSGNMFSIDSNTGDIKTNNIIDREKLSKYTLTVQAKDYGRPSLQTQKDFFITVIDINDNAPIFNPNQYSKTIKENSQPKEIMKVVATDDDDGTNAEIEYTIVGGQENEFRIDRNSGSISLVKPLDYGKKRYYEILVKASDKGLPVQSGTATVYITIDDSNDYSPEFGNSTYTVSLNENVKIGSDVVTVLAVDKDSGTSGEVQYFITMQDSLKKFQIHPQSGKITTSGTIDYEVKYKYEIQVQASDRGSPKRETNVLVIVNIVDLNDNAPVLTTSSVSVVENTQNGKEVSKLNATDDDNGANGQIVYSLISKNVPFSLDSNGILKVRSNGNLKVIDRETKDMYNLEIQVQDKGKPQKMESRGIVHVKVMDQNDNKPVFTRKLYKCNIRENLPTNTHLCYVEATDRDLGENAHVKYALETPSAIFSIVPETGEIRTRKSFDRELKDTYVISVVAMDQGRLIQLNNTVHVEINVTDMNDNNPVFQNTSYVFKINEEMPDDIVVGKILATDNDIGTNGDVRYELVSGHIQNNVPKFSVTKDPKTKEAILKAVTLDREINDKYRITVKAIDKGTPSLSTEIVVVVDVDDINDNTPTFTKTTYMARVRETTALGTYVLKIEATDRDIGSNGEIVYSFSGGANQADFRLDPQTGVIYTNKSLDYETVTKYEFQIKATDKGNTPRFESAKVEIHVINEDDNVPVFDKIRTIVLPENTAVGREIVQVKATDKDQSNLTYKIMGGNSEGKFELKNKNDKMFLVIKETLDREKTDKYNITISASDTSNTAVYYVPINVTDINDNAPIFEQPLYQTNITEDIAVNVTIFNINANDKDVGLNAEIEYIIQSGNIDNKFKIDKYTGVIVSAGPFDREKVSKYKLHIVARDKGLPSLQSSKVATVIVIDINDNPPIFEKSSYTVDIQENTNVNTNILDIRATDIDEGTNAAITYTISNDTKAFKIDKLSGKITTLLRLDRETTERYQFVVEASDNGFFKLRSCVNIVVNILDINDNVPVIESPNLPNINESEPLEFVVGTIKTSDRDKGLNAQLVYLLTEENDGGFFKIDSNTGEISLAKKLDRESKSYHNLIITVKDKGRPMLKNSTTTTIYVLDNNDNAPTFKRDVYIASVKENTVSILLSVQASDRDIGPNAEIVYSLIDDKSGLFTINSMTGQLEMKKPADFETLSSHVLLVQAADWKFKAKMNVTVDILNLNDNAPMFNSKMYQAEIPEDQDFGTTVLTVKATDRDNLGTLSYSITQKNIPFEINSNTGVITVAGKLDRETKEEYIFNVSVTDNGEPEFSAETIVKIKIGDINDNRPTFENYRLTTYVRENANEGITVIKVRASDRDIGSNAEIRYREKGLNKSSDFQIEAVSGVVKTKRSFDRERELVRTFTIEAYDLGDSQLVSEEVELVVSILDENDNMPKWKENDIKLNVSENLKNGTQVKFIEATDADIGENGRIKYSIMNPLESPLSIDANSGVLSVSKELDREVKDKYVIHLKATDNGRLKLSSNATLELTLLDENDNIPKVLEPLSGSIEENKADSTYIMRISATDMDIGKNGEVFYKLENYLDLFEINKTNGKLISTKPLDREEQDTYVLKVIVQDRGVPQLETRVNVTIKVSDKDDNCPIFESNVYKAIIKEDAIYGTNVTTVKAIDKDIGTNSILDYGILEANDKGAFTVDSKTGVVSVRGKVDMEYTKLYKLKIRAGNRNCEAETDDRNIGEGERPTLRNYTTTMVLITVTDVNDNGPVFENIEKNVYFNSLNQTEILKLNATDKDLGPGGEVNYDILESKQGDGKNNVTVIAKDNGNPSYNSSLVLVVVNNIRCDAMRFNINKKSGLLTVETLCTVKNTKEGEMIALKNTNFELNCEAEGNIPGIKYRWMKDGVSISDWRSGGSWTLEEIQLDQKGSYSCLASNGAGTLQSNPTILIVHEKPVITKQPKGVTVSINEPFKLTVNAVGTPQPTFQWYKNNKTIKGETRNELSFSNSIIEDSSDYYCIASNSEGESTTGVVKVQVFQKDTEVSIRVRIMNSDPKKNCHYFFPEDFEKAATKILQKELVVTKVIEENKNIKLCNVTACTKNPCNNDGECRLLHDGRYQCQCKLSWEGKNCEIDVNECNHTVCYQKGLCSNMNGSFACNCPVGFTGHRCEYKNNSCYNNNCTSDQICVSAQSGNFTCLDKSKEITLIIDSNVLLGWNDEKKYILQDRLTEILQTQPDKVKSTRRKRRDTTKAIDFQACVIHVIESDVTSANKTRVKIALDCSSGNNKNNSEIFISSLCQILLSTKASLGTFDQCGQPNKMYKPKDRELTTVTVDVRSVLKQLNGAPFSQKEAISIMEEKDMSGQMSKQEQMKVEVLTSNPKIKRKSSTGIIVGVLCAVIALIAAAAFLYVKKNRQMKESTSKTMQNRSKMMMNSAYSRSDLLPRIANKNPAFADDEVDSDGAFMFEMPTNLK